MKVRALSAVIAPALLLAACSAMNRMAEKANEPPKTAEEKVAEKYGPGGTEYSTQPDWYLSRYGEPDHRFQRETAVGTALVLTWNCAEGDYIQVTWRRRTIDDAAYWAIVEKTTATGICD